MPAEPSKLATLFPVRGSGLANVRPKSPWKSPIRADHCGRVMVNSSRNTATGVPSRDSGARRCTQARMSGNAATKAMNPNIATSR